MQDRIIIQMEQGIIESVKKTQENLASIVLDWEEDGSSPPNFVRKNGLGKEMVRVDRWCGGFQNPRKPETIGWRAQVGNRSEHEVVRVTYPWSLVAGAGLAEEASIDRAITRAKELADAALLKLLKQ